MNIDYIELTSLKFHIELFLQNNIDEQYTLQHLLINLSQNDELIFIHLTNTKYQDHNKAKVTLRKSKYTFHYFLVILKNMEKQFDKINQL
jgi:hypothetical protein